MNVRFASLARVAPLAAVLLALLTFPLVGQEFYIELVAKTMILAIFAMSLQLLVGHTGLVSFGHAAYYGIGAYALALLPLADRAVILVKGETVYDGAAADLRTRRDFVHRHLGV